MDFLAKFSLQIGSQLFTTSCGHQFHVSLHFPLNEMYQRNMFQDTQYSIKLDKNEFTSAIECFGNGYFFLSSKV